MAFALSLPPTDSWKGVLAPDGFVKLIVDTGVMMELCENFWGKSMHKEEENWRLSRTDDDVNKDNEDAGGDVGGVGEDIDEDQRNFDEDDMGKGCYALNIDIDIPGFLTSLWIRADYIRIYDFIQDYELKSAHKYRGAVLTGQPGSGEFVSKDFTSPAIKYFA